MLMAVSALKGFTISASDGTLGSAGDLLFDDQTWKIRWFVVDTGGWLSSRKVLIHPSAITRADASLLEIQVKMTKAQIEASPDLSTHEPVSRQAEAQVFDYYGWDPFWGSSYVVPAGGPASAQAPPAEAPGDPHLRGVADVIGYHLIANDGAIGHVENMFIDDRAWDIRYLVVDTGNWWPGAHVLLSPYAVEGIDAVEREIRLTVDRERVKASPPWDPRKMFDEVYEKRLHRHYRWGGYGF
jgi:hypothetical protein